jgi:hypothetical protein
MKNGGVNALPENTRSEEKICIMEKREKEKIEREESKINAEQNHERFEQEIAELKALLMEKLYLPTTKITPQTPYLKQVK